MVNPLWSRKGRTQKKGWGLCDNENDGDQTNKTNPQNQKSNMAPTAARIKTNRRIGKGKNLCCSACDSSSETAATQGTSVPMMKK